jgi:hypothetical protein
MSGTTGVDVGWEVAMVSEEGGKQVEVKHHAMNTYVE